MEYIIKIILTNFSQKIASYQNNKFLKGNRKIRIEILKVIIELRTKVLIQPKI